MAKPSRCAVQNTVVGTVASASFLPGMTTLAASAHAVGFPCIVVQPFDWFDGLNHEQVVSLPVATPPLLPRSGYCKPEQRAEYGWRRSQLYRVRLWRVVARLTRGFTRLQPAKKRLALRSQRTAAARKAALIIIHTIFDAPPEKFACARLHNHNTALASKVLSHR